MHKVIPSPAECISMAMSSAISDLRYDLHKGYLFRIDLNETLRTNGLNSFGFNNDERFKFPKNLRNSEVMKSALTKAIDLPNDKTNASLSNGKLRPASFIPIGYVDFFKFAYRIFGYTVSAPYNFFFVLLGCACLIYYFSFISERFFLLFLPMYLIGILSLYKAMESGNIIDWETIYNYRVMPVLVILPTIHIIGSFLKKSVHSKTEIILFCLSSVFIYFIILIRSCAFWVILLAFSLFLLKNLYLFFKNKNIDSFKFESKKLLFLFCPAIIADFIYNLKTFVFFTFMGKGSLETFTLMPSQLYIRGIKLFSVFLFIIVLFSRRKKFVKDTEKWIKLVLPFFFIYVGLSFLTFYLSEFNQTRAPYLILNSICTLSLTGLIYFTIRALLSNSYSNTLIRSIYQSPLTILIFTFFSLRIFTFANVNPIFTTNDSNIAVSAFHSYYVGLLLHRSPSDMRLFFNENEVIPKDLTALDDVIFAIGEYELRDNLKRSNKPHDEVTLQNVLTSKYMPGVKMGLQNLLVKNRFIKRLRQYPYDFIKIYIRKYTSLERYTKKYSIHWKSSYWLATLIFMLATMYFLITKNHKEVRNMFILSTSILFSAIFSTAPSFIAYTTEYAICDWLILFYLASSILSLLLLYYLTISFLYVAKKRLFLAKTHLLLFKDKKF